MPSGLESAIAERFVSSRVERRGSMVHADLIVGDVTYRARLEMAPFARVAVALPCTDGFELALKWNDRWANDGVPQPASFDDSFLVETNDYALAKVWLDGDARAGLLASRYVSAASSHRQTAQLIRDGGWLHEVTNDEVTARRTGIELSPDRMGDMLMASLLLASRPVRWARQLAVVGRAIGAEPSSRIEVGGKPVLRARRHGVDVRVHVRRRLGPGDPGRLRTIVGAHRQGSSGETLSLISDGLPRAAWPPIAEGSTGTLHIDARAAHLLDAARPSSSMVRPHDVEIAFDGALADPDRLGAAIELASWWATESRRTLTGPYR